MTQAQTQQPRTGGRTRPRSTGGGIAGQTPKIQPSPDKPQARPAPAPAKEPAQPAGRPAMKYNEPVADFHRFKQIVTDNRQVLGDLLNNRLPVDLFMRCAINAYSRVKDIQACSGKSAINALGIAAGMGLLVNGIGGDGWLGVFKNQYEEMPELTFMPGYQGLIRLAYQSPEVVCIKGECVRQGDHFKWDCGTNGFVEHNWDLSADGNREKQAIVGAWAMASMRNSAEPIIVCMNKIAIDQLRNTDNDPYSVMWSRFPDTGYRKAPLRRLCKLLPKSPNLSMAMTLEDRYDLNQSVGDLSPVPCNEVKQTRTESLASTLHKSV